MTDRASEQRGLILNRVLIVALAVALGLLFCCGKDWI